MRTYHLPTYNQPLNTFSKGMMIKFQLAFALAHHPVLYLMDEPTAGLDPVFRKDFLKLLQEIVAKENASMMISTHITSDLDKFADYIAFLENGKLARFEDRETLEEVFASNTGGARLQLADLFE